MSQSETLTFCKDTYKIVAIDYKPKRRIEHIIKFPKRIIKPWFIFRWLIKPTVLVEGFYYDNDNYARYYESKREIEIDGMLFHKPSLKIRFSKIGAQGGFERELFLNSDEDAEEMLKTYSDSIENKIIFK